MRELCHRNGVVLPTLPRRLWLEEREGSDVISVLVISNGVGEARRMLDALESELGCIEQFNLTQSADEATTADCVLLLLSRGVLHGPSLDCLVASIDEDKRVQHDRIVAVYDPSEWEFGCQEQKQAPEMVQECLNNHEAMTFRPRDPDGPSRHEFPAMVAQLRLKLGAVVGKGLDDSQKLTGRRDSKKGGVMPCLEIVVPPFYSPTYAKGTDALCVCVCVIP